METLAHSELYILQDAVLKAVVEAHTSFYLTGGTCLHRFYVQWRHSEDLDFFSSDNDLFRDDVRLALDALSFHGLTFERSVNSRDFVRILVQGRLKTDFVNDRVYRHGRSVRTQEGLMLDNIENMAANKICAVLGRDEPKDIFDLVAIHAMNSANWTEILNHARKKCVFQTEELEARFKSFPLNQLTLLPVFSSDTLSHVLTAYPRMVSRILQAGG